MKKEYKTNIFCLAILLLVIVGCSKETQVGPEQQIPDRSLLEVRERGKLVVVSDVPYGVMEFFDESGNAAGIDVDIVQEIASSLGVELEFRDYDWESVFVAIKTGESDLAISSITITAERSEEMLFSRPYFNGGQAIVVKKDNDNIKLPDDLADKKVGVQIETTGYDAVQKYTSDELILTYKTIESPDPESGMLYDLKTGNIDAVVLDYIAAVSIVKEDSSLKIVGEPFTQEFYGIATKLGNDALMNEVNSILREMKRSGRLDEIINKWTK